MIIKKCKHSLRPEVTIVIDGEDCYCRKVAVNEIANIHLHSLMQRIIDLNLLRHYRKH
jgi:hypothetical protein